MNDIYVVDRIFRSYLLGEAHGWASQPRHDTPVQFEIAPALRIGAKEDDQAQDRAGVNEGNFAGHAVSLFDNTYHSLIIAA
jgi:hypothetical protein